MESHLELLGGLAVAKMRLTANEGKVEFFEGFRHFGTTTKHPDWLGDDSAFVQSTRPIRC